VAALAGDEVEARQGDGVRAAEGELYGELVGEVEPFAGARELLSELVRRGSTVVLASSAKAEEVDVYLDLLDGRDLAAGWTTAADVEATKPEPDLVHAALAKAGDAEAVMVGDTTWDCEAAARAGVGTIAVLTGGFSEQELREAGAAAVFRSVDELRRRLDETPFA
jgi:HAD superfamily hydrolase (TIGR01509 family)